jgi:hypothetical protein
MPARTISASDAGDAAIAAIVKSNSMVNLP